MKKEEKEAEEMSELYKDIEQIVSAGLVKFLQDPNVSLSTRKKKFQSYVHILEEAKEFLGSGSGSLLFWVTVASLEALESLWKKSLSGALTNGFQREVATEECLRKMNLKSIKVKVQMRREDYLKAKGRLQAGNCCWRKALLLAYHSFASNIYRSVIKLNLQLKKIENIWMQRNLA